MKSILRVLKEYTNPPAKSQQQWKLFAIVRDVQKNEREAPSWYGRGKNRDKQMISMMASKIPGSEVLKFLKVNPNTLPKYVDGESGSPGIDKMYKDKVKYDKSKKGGGSGKKAAGPHSKMSDKPVKKGQKRGGSGRPRKSTPRNINKALQKVGNLNKSKSKTAKFLRNRGYTKKHQDAAKKHGDWTKAESLKPIRNIIVEEIREAMSSTERMRRYNKRHPEKVKQNLKKTQDDRVKRNKAHNDKTEEYGTELMRNKDVHHPNGASGNGAKIVNGDHGRDKKK